MDTLELMFETRWKTTFQYQRFDCKDDAWIDFLFTQWKCSYISSEDFRDLIKKSYEEEKQVIW